MAGYCLCMFTTNAFSAQGMVVGLRSFLVGRAGTDKGELDGKRAGARKQPLETLHLNLTASDQQHKCSEHK